MKKEIAFALTLIAAQPAADSKDALTAHQTYKSVVNCQDNDAAFFKLLLLDATTKANILKLQTWKTALLGGGGDGDKDEDVPESEFVGLIRGWITQILTELKSIKSDYTDGAFDFATAAKKLPSFLTMADGGSIYPIVIDIAVAIQGAAKDKTTLHDCIDACAGALSKFDGAYLSSKYKDGKQEYYGNKQMPTTDKLKGALPTRTDFHNALVAGCAECGQLPNKQARVAHDKDEFCNYYASLLDNLASAVYIIANDSWFVVNGSVLKERLNNVIEMDLGKEFAVVTNAISNDSLSFPYACRKIAIGMRSLSKDTKFLETLYESHKFETYPATHVWVEKHILNTIREQGGILDNSLKEYKNTLVAWSGTIKFVVQDCPVNSFSIAKLKELIPSAFSGIYLDYAIMEFLGKEFQAQLSKHQKDTIKKDDLIMVWDSFMQAGIDVVNISTQFQACKTYFAQSPNLAARVAQNLHLHLPNDKQLVDLMQLCAHR